MPSLVDRIYQIESHHGTHGDREHWVLDVFDTLFGLTPHQGTRSEVYLGPGKGRADVLVQEDVVIEVKKDLEQEEQEAERQLSLYFSARSFLNVGVATDGLRWRFYVRVHGEPRLYHEMNLAAESTDEQFKEILLKTLQAFRRKTPPPVDAAELCETLKMDTPTFRLSTSLLTEAAAHSPRFRVERRAWIGEFSQVYPGFDDLCKRLGGGSLERGYDRLYIRHTYLVVIAKLLAAIRIFDDARLHQMIDRNPGQVLDGRSLSESGVHVSDPDDYFSWVGHPSDELKTFIRELFLSLVRFDFSAVDEDVFRLLYEEIIDADTRHSIGEFYTPRWLAQFITTRAIVSGDDVVLDPACGSGTFLVESLRYRSDLRETGRKLSQGDLTDLVDQTWGFDINPLAVLLSRVNLYLAVSRIAQRHGLPTPAAFNPHIHTADSLSRIRSSLHRSRLQRGSGFFVTLAQSTVPVPASVSTLEDAIKVGKSLSKVCDEYVSMRSGGRSHGAALAAALEVAPNSYRPSIGAIVNSLREALEEGTEFGA
jgi:N-6 DNA methylase